LDTEKKRSSIIMNISSIDKFFILNNMMMVERPIRVEFV
jgi:hypothetical protein